MYKNKNVNTFKNQLQQLVLILQPLMCACKCLELFKATVDDVYLFWLTVLATHKKLFIDNDDINGLQLPDNVMEDIHKIVNACWAELTMGPGKSVYISTLFLDPCKYFVPSLPHLTHNASM